MTQNPNTPGDPPAPDGFPVSEAVEVVVSAHWLGVSHLEILTAFSRWPLSIWVASWSARYAQDSRSFLLRLLIVAPSASRYSTGMTSTARTAPLMRSLETHFSRYKLNPTWIAVEGDPPPHGDVKSLLDGLQ